MSLVRGLYLISMTHYDVLSLLFKLLNLILYLKTLNSHLFYFLFNIVIFFSTCFFDNITLCINLPNVTLSNMSHLVYVTLFGETDGVTLSRLGCSQRGPGRHLPMIQDHADKELIIILLVFRKALLQDCLFLYKSLVARDVRHHGFCFTLTPNLPRG